MTYKYKTQDTCSTEISFDLNDGIVSNIQFTGGCNGNLKALSKVLDGLPAEQITSNLSGITCGRRPTSCGDQLARAIKEAVEKANN